MPLSPLLLFRGLFLGSLRMLLQDDSSFSSEFTTCQGGRGDQRHLCSRVFTRIFLFVHVRFVGRSFSLVLFDRFFRFQGRSRAETTPDYPGIGGREFISVVGRVVSYPMVGGVFRGRLTNGQVRLTIFHFSFHCFDFQFKGEGRIRELRMCFLVGVVGKRGTMIR